MRKAIREAKEHTSWTAPDPAYESAVEDFVAGVLADPEVMGEVTALAADIDLAAHVNSLAAGHPAPQRCPGSPTPIRAPSSGTTASSTPTTGARSTSRVGVACSTKLATRTRSALGATTRSSGLPKLVVLDRLLHLRAQRPSSFGCDAAYEPLEVADDRAVAFVRGGDVAVVVPRLGRCMVEARLGSRCHSASGGTCSPHAPRRRGATCSRTFPSLCSERAS